MNINQEQKGIITYHKISNGVITYHVRASAIFQNSIYRKISLRHSEHREGFKNLCWLFTLRGRQVWVCVLLEDNARSKSTSWQPLSVCVHTTQRCLWIIYYGMSNLFSPLTCLPPFPLLPPPPPSFPRRGEGNLKNFKHPNLVQWRKKKRGIHRIFEQTSFGWNWCLQDQ